VLVRALEERVALTPNSPILHSIRETRSRCYFQVCTELAKLQDRMPPFADAVAFKLIEEELGRPLADLFEAIGPAPVAAASLGQVGTTHHLPVMVTAQVVCRPRGLFCGPN